MPEVHKLNVKICEAVKDKGKYPDGEGLYLYVSKAGGKVWRYDYRYGGKRYTLTIGKFPTISLKEARESHAQAKLQLARGVNPASEKQAQKQQVVQQAATQQRTFGVVAMDWFDLQQSGNVERTRRSTLQRMQRHILPALGNIPFSEITFEKLREVVKNLEEKNYRDEHRRVTSILTQICRHAKINRWSEHNIAEDLSYVLKKRQENGKAHFPAITDKNGVGGMLRSIDTFVNNENNSASPFMRAALQLYPLTVQRASELLMATWNEIDFERFLWIVPAGHMKRKKEHIIPLSRQAIQILNNLYKFRAKNDLIFHSRGKMGHITSDGVNKAMRLAGIPKGEMTLHGWRQVFSTLCHDAGVPHDLIEVSLAHEIGNAVSQAYNKATYLAQRRKLMQWWADYLDCLRMEKATPAYE